MNMQPNQENDPRMQAMSACHLYLDGVIDTDMFMSIINAVKIKAEKKNNDIS